VRNVKKFGVPCVVALNRFITDADEEIEAVRAACAAEGVEAVRCEVWEKGGEGGKEVAQAVLALLDQGKAAFKPLYDERRPIAEKIETIAKEIYGAGSVAYAPPAARALELLPKLGLGETPVCMAKTQYSFSANGDLYGAPEGFTLPVREVRLSAGAEFVVVICGDIMTMPGLPRIPSAENMYVNEQGQIIGLS
jgi:formate--tetrahydrofolate ligase